MERVHFISVSAPETGVTPSISGADIFIEQSRRVSGLGATIDAHAFNLTEVGHVPGSEREYEEEQLDLSESESDLDSHSTTASVKLDDLDEDLLDLECSETVIVSGTPSEDSFLDPFSALVAAEENPEANSVAQEGSMEDLSVEIDKAVTMSMLRSVRDTTVLSVTSKKQTMLGLNRVCSTMMNMDFPDEEGSQEDVVIDDILDLPA